MELTTGEKLLLWSMKQTRIFKRDIAKIFEVNADMASDMYDYLKKQNVINKNGLVLRCGVDEITATRNAERLKEYRQLEKNGKIFLSICKIGDPVWRIININKNDYYVAGPFVVEDVATKEIKFDDTWYRINDPMIFFDKDECWEMMDRIDNGEFEE